MTRHQAVDPFIVAKDFPDVPAEATLPVLYEKLCAAFGAVHPYDFPRLPRRAGILDWRLFSINRQLNAGGIGRLNQARLDRYWREVAKGQDYREDAGGFGFRCWAVALGWQLSQGEVTMHAARFAQALSESRPTEFSTAGEGRATDG